MEDPDLVDEAIRRMKEDSAAASRQGGAWREIGQPWLRTPILIGILIFFFQQFSGINTIIYYSPIIFQMAGFTSNAESIAPAVVVGMVNVLFTFVSIALLDRVGRRPLYLVGFSGLIVALAALGLSFQFQAQLGEATKWATVGSMLLFCAFFAMSLGPLGWLIISEVYPLRVRGIGVSIRVAVPLAVERGGRVHVPHHGRPLRPGPHVLDIRPRRRRSAYPPCRRSCSIFCAGKSCGRCGNHW